MQQKCIYASRNILKGEKIKTSDLVIKGPGGGILPKYMDILIGREVRIDIKADTSINWDEI
jgi:sialic acid synthase SpsE